MVLSVSVGTGSSAVQFITVLVVFVFVLVLAYGTSKWIAGFQKEQNSHGNISIIEAKRIAPNKSIEIVKIGDKMYALAICKDTVTLISEIDENSIDLEEPASESFKFKDFLEAARRTKKDN